MPATLLDLALGRDPLALLALDGKPESEALIGEKEPHEDQRNSHGICEHHRAEVEERATRLREEARKQEAAAKEQRDAAEDVRKSVDP